MILVKLDLFEGNRLPVVVKDSDDEYRLCRFMRDAESAFNERERYQERLHGENPWQFLVGRKFRVGEVKFIYNDTAVMEHGDDEFRILISELIEEHFKEQDKADAAMSEALNSGDGSYRP